MHAASGFGANSEPGDKLVESNAVLKFASRVTK